MSDPVADKSGFLKMYMSNHPDTLVAYAKWYGKVTEAISSAEMSAIDSKSMTLTCTMKKDGAKQPVRITLDPPLAGYEDVKPRLLEMKALAQEGLGMIGTPQITSFNISHPHTAASGILISTICYLALSPAANTSPLFFPAHVVTSFIGSTIPNFAFYTLVVLHVFESLYTSRLCRKHKTSPGYSILTIAYVAATFYLGYPVWAGMRKRIQSARIDSVMKVE
ncbi:hypothetical protein BD779DRAFT_1545536 [Infundibulicybe gibba]|nr:hypothetical protein BD779DRAFT_1545536 [Infundibulicybe gibba]